MTAYKGFKQDLTCRDYQFEIGGTYKHDGEVEACASGFHACEYPLDVFGYYQPAGSRFALVEQSGDLSRHDNDSKVASRKISIKAEITIAGLVKAAIEYTTSRCKPVDSASPASSTGDQGAASSTGKHSVAMACGIEGKARAAAGSAIVLCYRDADAEGDDYARIVHIKAGIAGQDGVKPDTWYQLSAEGEFVEFEE
ncbi:TPA: hypothetical protein ACPH4X_003361 [Pseudomonas aeruginosa]